jgi:hypothetical protein
MEAARLSIRAVAGADIALFADPLRAMVVSAELFVGARSADREGLQTLMQGMGFKFDIQLLLAAERGHAMPA